MSRLVSWLRASRPGAGLGHRVGPKLSLSVLALSAASVGVLDTLLISGAGSYALGALDACATLACGVLAVRIGWHSRRGKSRPTEPTAPSAMPERAPPAHKMSSPSLDSQRLHQRAAASRRRPRRA
jgi:hypothetical protein